MCVFVEGKVRPVLSGAGEEGAVFGGCESSEWVCLMLYVYASVLRLVYLWGVGSPRVWNMSVHDQVYVPIDTSKPVV
jgi:hypothetical protein